MFAGTTWGTQFEERATHVKNKLRNKYQSVVETPYWSDDEVTELGYNLRAGVMAWQGVQKSIRRRLAWDAVAYLRCIDDGQYFAVASVEMQNIIKSEKENWRSSVVGRVDNRKFIELNRHCRQCGKSFKSWYRQRFCNSGCRRQWDKLRWQNRTKATGRE
jgi:hypothetical protein